MYCVKGVGEKSSAFSFESDKNTTSICILFGKNTTIGSGSYPHFWSSNRWWAVDFGWRNMIQFLCFQNRRFQNGDFYEICRARERDRNAAKISGEVVAGGSVYGFDGASSCWENRAFAGSP